MKKSVLITFLLLIVAMSLLSQNIVMMGGHRYEWRDDNVKGYQVRIYEYVGNNFTKASDEAGKSFDTTFYYSVSQYEDGIYLVPGIHNKSGKAVQLVYYADTVHQKVRLIIIVYR